VIDIKPAWSFVGVEAMDKEQLQLGSSDKFWKLIAKRRSQRTISRAELERKIKARSQRTGRFGKGNVH
jgi:chromosome condensin MukBEF MukE localization factor